MSTPPNLARLIAPEYLDPFTRRRRRNRRRLLYVMFFLLLAVCGALLFGWWTERLDGWFEMARDRIFPPASSSVANADNDGPGEAPGNDDTAEPSSVPAVAAPPRTDAPPAMARTEPNTPAAPPFPSSSSGAPEPARPAGAASGPAQATPATAVRPPNQPVRPVAATSANAANMATPAAAGQVRRLVQASQELAKSDPAAARAQLEAALAAAPPPAPEDAATILYTLGSLADAAGNQGAAENYWMKAVLERSRTIAGRYAAMVLADRYHARYAGAPNRDPAQFENIWNLYSTALGIDDGQPFAARPLDRQRMRTRAKELAQELVFGPAPLRGQREHTVKSGERLGDIARKYGVNFEAVAAVNRIDPRLLRIGRKLKIVDGNVLIVVRKNTAYPEQGPTLSWYLDGRLTREYPACVGEGNKTPPGEYVVVAKETNPTWTKDGVNYPYGHPENILGTRWMAMEGMGQEGMGIHGTTLPETIPGYTSAGCVRLLNQDVEELYGFARFGDGLVTKVIIQD